MSILTGAIFAFLLAAASAVPAADLVSIYREAQTADAVFAGARASYLAGQEKLPQGMAGLLPAVTLSANTQYNDRDLQFRDGGAPASASSGYNSNSLAVVATQPLFRYQNWIAYEQAKNQVSQALPQVDWRHQQLPVVLLGRVARQVVE